MKTLIVLLWAFALLFVAAVRDDAVLSHAKQNPSECVAALVAQGSSYVEAVADCSEQTGLSFTEVEEALP